MLNGKYLKTLLKEARDRLINEYLCIDFTKLLNFIPKPVLINEFTIVIEYLALYWFLAASNNFIIVFKQLLSISVLTSTPLKIHTIKSINFNQ